MRYALSTGSAPAWWRKVTSSSRRISALERSATGSASMRDLLTRTMREAIPLVTQVIHQLLQRSHNLDAITCKQLVSLTRILGSIQDHLLPRWIHQGIIQLLQQLLKFALRAGCHLNNGIGGLHINFANLYAVCVIHFPLEGNQVPNQGSCYLTLQLLLAIRRIQRGDNFQNQLANLVCREAQRVGAILLRQSNTPNQGHDLGMGKTRLQNSTNFVGTETCL